MAICVKAPSQTEEQRREGATATDHQFHNDHVLRQTQILEMNPCDEEAVHQSGGERGDQLERPREDEPAGEFPSH